MDYAAAMKPVAAAAVAYRHCVIAHAFGERYDSPVPLSALRSRRRPGRTAVLRAGLSALGGRHGRSGRPPTSSSLRAAAVRRRRRPSPCSPCSWSAGLARQPGGRREPAPDVLLARRVGRRAALGGPARATAPGRPTRSPRSPARRAPRRCGKPVLDRTDAAAVAARRGLVDRRGPVLRWSSSASSSSTRRPPCRGSPRWRCSSTRRLRRRRDRLRSRGLDEPGEVFTVLFATWGRLGVWRFRAPGRRGLRRRPGRAVRGVAEPHRRRPAAARLGLVRRAALDAAVEHG